MKPLIKYWKHGLWECAGKGLHSFGHSAPEAYSRWLHFNTRMREN